MKNFYINFTLLLLFFLTLTVNAADESKSADVTKNPGETGTIERIVEKYSDSLYIPLLSSKSYIREMDISVGGNNVIKRADKVEGDPGSNWMIIKGSQEYSSHKNVHEKSVLYRGTQKKGKAGKEYRPEFSGSAGPTGSGGGGKPAAPTDYEWNVKMAGNHAIMKHKIGVCGPAIAFEGSTTRRIELYMGRTKDSPTFLMNLPVTVYFTIDFTSSNLLGIHREDFSGYQNGEPSSIFVSGASWDSEKQAFKTTILSGLNLSPKIVMEAAMQTGLQEKSAERADLTIVQHENYMVVETPEESKATFFNWITNKQEQNAKLFPKCDIYVLKDITRFGDKNNPSLQGAGNISTNDIKQGSTGDCYFLAVLLALADHPTGRTFLMNHSNQYYANNDEAQSNNKTFSVGFAGQANTTYSFKSNSPTFLNVGQRQAALSEDYHLEDNALQDGAEIWPQLYEAAWVEYREGKPGLFTDRWKQVSGGDISVTWTKVTGKDAQWIDARGMTNNEIEDTIKEANSMGKWVCVGAQWKPGMEHYGDYDSNNLSTTGLHAYYVQHVFTDTIYLLNPWGQNRSVDLKKQDYSAIEIIYILDPVN